MVLYSGEIALQLDKNLSKWLYKKGAEVTEIDPESLPDELYINTISVDPGFRRKGIGSQLLDFAEDIAKRSKHFKSIFKCRNRKRRSYPTV